jgi:tight adherence protein B
MIGPLLFGLLVALAIMAGFVALWRIMRSRDPVEARLAEYSVDGAELLGAEDEADTSRRPAWRGVNRLLAGLGLGPRLALSLARADVSLTAAEFALIILGAGVLGFLIGMIRQGLLLGLALGAALAILPNVYLSIRRSRRQRAFTEQLPDVLTLLVGGLRAGYGLSQALEMLVDEMPAPASTEFARVMRAVSLGLPIQRALIEMSDRVGIDDLHLVVTAINVQYEMGGNLAQTLETIGETVRDRIYMLREIQVLTAQQRMTGYVLAVWPLVVAIVLFLVNPGYMRRLLDPGLRLVPVVAVLMQVAGFLVIRRIVDIEV